MLRKKRLKPLKDGIGETDASPLLVKTGRREESWSGRRRGLQLDDGFPITQPTTPMSRKAKKLMIKVKNTSRQPLVEKESFPQSPFNSSMDISSIMPYFTCSTSTESDNSLPETRTSQRSAKKIYPEKGIDRKLNSKKSEKYLSLAQENEEESEYSKNTFSPHAFPVNSTNETLEGATKENTTKGLLSAFIEDNSWVMTVGEGSNFTSDMETSDVDCNEEDSFKYHDFISEAVVLRLKKDKKKNHGNMKYSSSTSSSSISSSSVSSVISDNSTVINSNHAPLLAVNERDFYVNLDSTEHIVVEQEQKEQEQQQQQNHQQIKNEPEIGIHGLHCDESARAEKIVQDTRKGILPKPDLLRNASATDTQTTMPITVLRANSKEIDANMNKMSEKRKDAAYGFTGCGEKKTSKVEAYVSKISNKHIGDKLKQECLEKKSPFCQEKEIKEEKDINVTTLSSYDHDIADTSLISICLLNLNGNIADTSSRLKSGFIIGGRRNSQSDREYLLRMGCMNEYGYIVLENITSLAGENDNYQLWKAMVPIDKNLNESSSGCGKEKFRLGRCKDMKSQIVTLLMNGDFDGAADLLHNKIETGEAQTGIFTWANIGSIQLWQGNYADAIISFESATECMDGRNASKEARTLALLGMALYGEKKFEEANQAYLRALTMLRTKTNKGYGCYTHRHDFVMGQIFNCVGCSFYETGFHKSATRSFLNALHIYLQDIFTSGLSADESQSVEFLLRTVKVNKTWTSHVPPPFILDTAITFSNLASVLSNRNNLALAISCLRLSLKLQMTADESMIDRDTIIATLEELGHIYKKFQHGQDAENVFGIILRTGRDKFSSTCTFHRTMYRASMVMKELKAGIQDYQSVTKYDELAQYHHTAALDAVKIEGICKEVCEQKANYSVSQVEGEEISTNSSDDTSQASPAVNENGTTSSSRYYQHSLSFD